MLFLFIFYIPETRSFTDQTIARDKSGIINQIMLHFLKLRKEFDYNRDHHFDDIVGWARKITQDMDSDKKSKGSAAMMDFYKKEIKQQSLLRSWTRFLVDNYGMKTRLTDDDFEFALQKTTQLLGCVTDKQKYDYLNNLFPEKP